MKITKYEKVTRELGKNELRDIIVDIKYHAPTHELDVYHSFNNGQMIYRFMSIPAPAPSDNIDEDGWMDYVLDNIPEDKHIDIT